ncbi:MAG: (2Fe-2S)-binding protein [Peptococcaceae bacterium]|nr:(2Fe-2S)-binding protein [Peptococcaceae bacterium]
MKKLITLNVNGRDYDVAISHRDLLVDVLRKKLGLTGTKKGCGAADCGACTVNIDGKNVMSCITLAITCEGKKITTVEGLQNPDGTMNPLQEAFVNKGAIQCGFCTPGMLMAATALLNRNPKPSTYEMKHGMAGNLCRCTGYKRILMAIEHVVEGVK